MGYVYALIAMIVVGIGSYFAGSRDGAKACVADREQKKVEVKAAKVTADAKAAARGSARVVEQVQDDAEAKPIVEEVKTDVAANPAAPECRVPARRLPRLNALISQANGTGEMPARAPAPEDAADGNPGRAGAVGDRHGSEVPRSQEGLPVPEGLGDRVTTPRGTTP